MISILQMRFVKSDQEKIIKITEVWLKSWYNGYLPFTFSWELVTQQGLTCSVVIIFLCHAGTSL